MIVNLFPIGKVNILPEHLGTWNVTKSVQTFGVFYSVQFTPDSSYVSSDSNWSISSADPMWSASDQNTPGRSSCSRTVVYENAQSQIIFTATRADNAYSDTYTYTE